VGRRRSGHEISVIKPRSCPRIIPEQKATAVSVGEKEQDGHGTTYCLNFLACVWRLDGFANEYVRFVGGRKLKRAEMG
jgi:hypothetical protein